MSSLDRDIDGGKHHSSKVAENELLYLVLKYFQSSNDFKEIATLLETQLVRILMYLVFNDCSL